MKSFPNPLTPSEEKQYIQQYTEGDLHAKHILIEHNLRLVAHVVKKYQYLDEHPEDLILYRNDRTDQSSRHFQCRERKPTGCICFQMY